MGEVINVAARTKEDVVAEIKATWAQVNQTAIWGAVKIGNALKELKGLVAHGEWGSYIEENCGFSQRKANRLMEIADNFGDEGSAYYRALSNSSTLTNLGISKALQLLSLPEDEVEAFAEGNDVGGLTVKQLEERIKEIIAEKEILEGSVETLEEGLEKAREGKELLEREFEEFKARHGQGDSGTDAISEAAKEEIAAKQAEIDKLAAGIARKEKKIESLQAKQAEADEKAQRRIEEARAELRETLRGEIKEGLNAEIEKLNLEAEAARQRAEAAEKKLASANNEDILMFKLKVNEMQEAFNASVDVILRIRESDREQADKMGGALARILGPMLAAAENHEFL